LVGGHPIKQSPRASPDLCTPLPLSCVFYNLCDEPWSRKCIKCFDSKVRNVVFLNQFKILVGFNMRRSHPWKLKSPQISQITKSTQQRIKSPPGWGCFIKANVLAPSNVYFSTTATYISCSFMYLCVSCYCDACLSLVRCVWERRHYTITENTSLFMAFGAQSYTRMISNSFNPRVSTIN